MEVRSKEIDLGGHSPLLGHSTVTARSGTVAMWPKRGEWTWTTPNRTGLEFPFRYRIYQQRTFQYQELSPKAKQLKAQGLSWIKVAKKLGVTDKTAKKAASKGSLTRPGDGTRSI